jgi:Putative zinc-finger
MKCSLLVLSSYLDGELEARREGELEAHLVGCQRCRAGLGYLREEVERIGGLGRVTVSEASMHTLLMQLGLIDDDELLPQRSGAVALAEAPREPWLEHPAAEAIGWTPAPALPVMPPVPSAPSLTEHDEQAVEIVAERPASAPDDGMPEPAAADEPPMDDDAESYWEPPEAVSTVPHSALPLPPPPTVPLVGGVPAFEPPLAVPPASPPATAASSPAAQQWPPSDLPTHVTASGGEPEMTASPPWAPHEAPPGPTYPLTDDDVLTEPVPVERFGPPVQTRPSFFERLRDRLAVRRTLARSTAAYDDSVQIVSGSGASLHTGRARLEVERRRLETLRMDPGGIPIDPHERAEPGDEVDALGPLPPTAPYVNQERMPRPGESMPRPADPASAGQPGSFPGQMPLPGTDDPHHAVRGIPAPTPRPGMDARSGSAAPPWTPPPPTSMPPAHPAGDALGEALSDFDRDRTGPAPHTEPRPWRPREFPAAAAPAAERETVEPQRRFQRTGAERSRHSPAQLRESRRLLALFGGATLVMLIVGIVSGRTSSPLPAASNTTAQQSAPAAPAQHTSGSQPAVKASGAPAVNPGPAGSSPAAPPPATAGGPSLTGTKVLGDTGTGYQIRDFRYGIHPNDFRIVLDLDPSGSAAGTPKATIGFLDPTTLLVSIQGVVAAGSTGQLPNTGTVTAVTLMQPSPFAGSVTYQIKLAHPLTFTAGYIPGPLRLVLDLAG